MRKLVLLTLAAALCGCTKGVRAPAPAAEFIFTNGKAGHLSDFKGKVVLIDFWASWCGPCADAAPAIHKLGEANRDQGLVLLSANTSDEAEGMDKAKMHEQEFAENASYCVADHLYEAFGSNSLPLFVVIDRNGRTALVSEGWGDPTIPELTEKIQQLLAEPAGP